MVEEVRRQFRDISGILEGKAKPDYKTCIEISSQGALKEMRMPAIISIIFPVIAGFLFGPYFVGGLLTSSTILRAALATASISIPENRYGRAPPTKAPARISGLVKLRSRLLPSGWNA